MRIGIDCRKVADFGIGTYVRGLTHALADLPGNETFVLLAPPDLHPLLPRSVRTELVDFDAPHYSARELTSLGSAARRLQLDLLHCPHYVVPFTAIPLVVTVHDLIHLRLPATRLMERVYASWMIGRAVSKSRRVLTVSRAVKDEIAARYRDSAEKITVTPNGIDPIFHGTRGAADLPFIESLGLVPDGYFLFVGNRKPHKNVERLLAAWESVAKRRPGLRLVLAGGNWSTAELPSGVFAAGLIPIDELAMLYRNALALMQPSIEEGFGLPVVEAMAAGTPVICSDIAVLTEVAGVACVTVDPFDPVAIGAAMLRLADDAEQRASLRTAGMLRAREFTWERCASATLNVYREALRPSSNP